MAFIGKKPTDAALTSSDVADDIITLAKMAGGTDGNIITYDASGNPAVVATGSDGQVLTSTGAGSAPAFETLSAGKVGQVVQTTKTDTTSTTSTGFEDISGMSVAITPSATSSKILVTAALSLSANTSIVYKVLRGSTDIFRGDANGNRARGIAGGTSMDEGMLDSFHYCYLDSPSSTSELTYKAQWLVQSDTGYLNRPHTDSNLTYYVVGASSITVMEILA